LPAKKPNWSGKVKIHMSKQYNKAEKRQRRNAYLKRRKERIKTKAAEPKVAAAAGA
jgi:hypothetical protein